MSKTHEYHATLTWSSETGEPIGGFKEYSREHTVEIEGKPTLRASADPGYLGDPALHNPEDLLLASCAACHMLFFLALSSKHKLPLLNYVDRPVGVMEVEGGKGRFTRMTLRPRAVFAGEVDRELAEKLHQQSHEGCFIANSVNFPIEVEPEFEVRG